MEIDEKEPMNELELKRIQEVKSKCKDWGASDWERYLKSLEGSQTELLLNSGGDVDNLTLESFKVGYLDLMPKERFAHLEGFLKTIMGFLTEKQMKILRMSFWMGKSDTEIGRILGTHRTTVTEHKKNALNKLGNLLEEITKKIEEDKTA